MSRVYVVASKWKTIPFIKRSIIVVNLRSYNGQDLKSYSEIWSIDSWSHGWDLVTFSLHTITWHDPDALMKIQRSQIYHNDSPLWIPSRPLISSRRRSDYHTQFQNIINSLFHDGKHSLIFRLVEPFGHRNPWISFFLPLLDSFLRQSSVWNQKFFKRIGRICLLNFESSSFETHNQRSWSVRNWIYGISQSFTSLHVP